MENKIDEYKKQFKPEIVELVVRVMWSWERGCSDFGMIDDCYKAEIHFDKALNVKTGVADSRFDCIREEYLKPVVINSEYGEFTLNRNYNRFEAEINYLGEKYFVNMNVEEGKIKADIQLNKLREIFSDLTNWSNSVKEYAANKLLELANEWCENEDEITKEQFIGRIGELTIDINEDGTVEVRFDSDNMFTDHGIVIDVDEDGNFKVAHIEG